MALVAIRPETCRPSGELSCLLRASWMTPSRGGDGEAEGEGGSDGDAEESLIDAGLPVSGGLVLSERRASEK